jgi:adenine-specific DNA-methyltransferase
MAKKRATKDAATSRVGDGTEDIALDYRHKHAKRSNIPTAANAAEGKIEATAKSVYSFDPHRPPSLRFDESGRSDRLMELLVTAQKQALSPSEAAELAEALQREQPWLEWAGKREQPSFVVDAPAIHIHERVSTRALLRIAARRDVQRSLFGDPEQPYAQSVQFYRHPMDWSNRLILGDNRAVMSSLAHRENLAGKVQMIYIDPPYGIRYASNFQSEIGRRDVKDSESDLSREMETVRAYRDTWSLGVHSYLAYLRECVTTARKLLTDEGSLFLQMGEENVHLARNVLDEVFGSSNLVSQIVYSKTSGATVVLLPGTTDYILWYAKDKETVKYNRIYNIKTLGGDGSGKYDQIQSSNLSRRSMTSLERNDPSKLKTGTLAYRLDNMMSQGAGRDKGEGAACWFTVDLEGGKHSPNIRNRWKTNEDGMRRLLSSNRVQVTGNSIAYVRFLDDFSAYPITNTWLDIGGIQSRSDPKVYVVQTSSTAIQRCMLMTTDPGDLVLDPTCGSGTTAYVAEQWGRRWITIDTSRVAIAIARQRLMTSKFDYFKLRDEANGPAGGFYYKTIPHITLRSIAQNAGLDPIFARHETILGRVDNIWEGCDVWAREAGS